MTIRCRTRLSALLFCLPFGLCVAGTAFGASDDDDEDWHDTKGPGGESLKSSDSDSKKKSDDDADKKSAAKADKDSDESSGSKADKSSDSKADDDAKPKRKKRRKHTSDGPPSTTKVSFALLGSYGMTDPLRPGVGLRGGVHIEGLLPFYFGGVAQYFFGTRSETKNFGEVSTRTLRFMYFGAEGGVDVEASTDVLLRPFLGLGIGLNTDRNCPATSPCAGGTKVHATLTPGIVGVYQMGSFFLGVDFRYLIVPGVSVTSGAVASATFGLSF
jgi:hypothetical protein